MLDNAPAVQIVRDFARPSAESIAAFKGLQTGFVVDAMQGGGTLDYRIKPLFADQSALCGVALTVDAGSADNLAVVAALEHAQPGDILVVTTHGHTGCAVVGDLVLGMARNNGIAGFVCDGCVRDTRGIRAVGLPCFAMGVSPDTPARNGPGKVGVPIVVGGIAVSPGDLVVADEDGVVIVPRARLEATIERLATVRAAEALAEAQVRDGMKKPGWL